MPLSPSTKMHQPSLPQPPSPARTFAKLSRAYRSTSSSNVPGWSHTDGMPRSLASPSALRVTWGGVMMDTPVSLGLSRPDRALTAGYCFLPTSIVAEAGLIGVTGRLWLRYHTKTMTLWLDPTIGVYKDGVESYPCGRTFADWSWRRPRHTATTGRRHGALPRLWPF